jgi:hypothetical protein
MKRLKPVNQETLRNRTEQAIFVLRKCVIKAGQQGLVTSEQSSILSGHISKFERDFVIAFPAPEKPKNESKACLPF